MPALSNIKWEKFAQGLAKGMTADAAYIAAGYKESRAAASRLSANVSIQARVSELVEIGAGRAEVSVERVLKEMARIGFSDVRKIFDENGNLKQIHDLDDDTASAVSAVKVVVKSLGEGEVEYVKEIKFWDKNSGLEKLAKHLNMFIDRVEHTVSDDVAEILDAARQRARQRGD